MESLSLGEVIKSARKDKNISIRELSRRTNISHPYLSQIETGKNDKPSKEFLLKLAEELDLSFVYLVSIANTDIGLKVPPHIVKILAGIEPSFFEKISTSEDFIKWLRNEKAYTDNPGYFTDDMIVKLERFYNDLKKIEHETRTLANMDIAFQGIMEEAPTSGIAVVEGGIIKDGKLSISLKEYLLNQDIEITVNDKPLTEEDKSKLLDIANTIFDK